MPEPPTPLPWRAATIPATCVPWPLSSLTLLLRSNMFAPWTSSTMPLLSSSRPLPAISPGFVQMFAREVGVVELHARVEDGDEDAGAVGLRPGLLGADRGGVGQRPLVRKQRVVRGGGHRAASPMPPPRIQKASPEDY